MRDLCVGDRKDLLTQLGGLTEQQAFDVESVLEMMPRIALDISCETEGEEGGVQEGDLVSLKAWVTISRDCGKAPTFPHTPHYPVPVEEHFWILLADTTANAVWVSQKLTFTDESAAILAVKKQTREKMEGEGAKEEAIKEGVEEAVRRVKGGGRLVSSKFLAPEEGVYGLTAFCISDVWIGCDKKVNLKLKVGGKRVATILDRSLLLPTPFPLFFFFCYRATFECCCSYRLFFMPLTSFLFFGFF